MGNIEENNEADSSYESDREEDGVTVTQVRRPVRFQEILQELTNEIRFAAHPLDHYTAMAIRHALVKAYRAVRARARRIKRMHTNLPQPQGQWARRGRRRTRRRHGRKITPHVNKLLHPVENQQLGELKEFFLSSPSTHQGNDTFNDADTIINIINTALEFNPLAEYGIVLRHKRINGEFGDVGNFPHSL